MSKVKSQRSDQVLTRLREICLAFPETSEAASWGHPNFRAGTKIFAAYEWIGGRPSIAFRLDPTDVDLLLRRKEFFTTPYGRGQWVSLRADGRLSWRLIERLVDRSYRLVALERMLASLDAGTRR
jgi:predicted DNA-binding protein (MmcQ/YjbR family)